MAKPIDLTGQTIGKWHIDSLAYVKGYDKYYNCTCECGSKKVVLGQNIRHGKSTSCGCEKHKQPKNFVDRTGMKYGELTCLEYEKRGEYIYWKCQCNCGNITWVRGINLTSGAVKSCGCIRGRENTVHGMSHTRLHRIWSKMLERCENANSAAYKWYGAEGKGVCPEWHGTDGFIRFAEWSLAHGYEEHLTIDRIDCTKGYSPDNCRWIPPKEQALNTRRNRRFTVNGETLTVKELSEKYGVPDGRVRNRLRWNWSIEEALELVPHHDRRKDIRHEKDGRFCSK